jgi:competence protein ComEC
VSAVVKLINNGEPVAVFTGDLDDVGLDNLVERGLDCRARVLVFPHHGGRPGAADMSAFARRLLALVQPQTVIFSISRGGRYINPQPEIVAAVRETLPDTRVACTQLSRHCAVQVPSRPLEHLTEKFALGRYAHASCGGTFVVELDRAEQAMLPQLETHLEFITRNAKTALCRQPVKRSKS